MSETSPKVEALRNKIQQYLSQKNLSYEVKPSGELWVREGSTVVAIVAYDWNEQTLVSVMAPVALDVKKVTAELTRFLAEKNHELLFGKFSLNPENNSVWYTHVLLGDYLDEAELFVAVSQVAIVADDYDEQIVKMTRGRRWID
ncbi:MAG: YbjN domain-containing protein [Anaerolineales bacterium]|jgi:hypothetical protein